MPHLLRLLRQPHPRAESRAQYAWTAVLAGGFVFGFLWFFEPFGLVNWHDPWKVWYLAGYGLVTSLVLAGLAVVEWVVFPRFFSEQTWTVGKAIGWTFCVLVSISLGNYLYNILAGMAAFRWHGFGQTLLATFSVGVFPSVLIPLANYVYYLRKYAVPPAARQTSFANGFPGKSKTIEEKTTSLRLELVAENGKDRLSIPLSDLLFIESSDNYSTVCYLRAGKICKQLIRSSLSRLESQLTVPEVVRCHRSYLVNMHRVCTVSGNAQGYRLHLDGCDTAVPVARKHSGLVKDRLAA